LAVLAGSARPNNWPKSSMRKHSLKGLDSHRHKEVATAVECISVEKEPVSKDFTAVTTLDNSLS
jgi:hypothetical protein